jgi:hypothetical protein
MSTEPDFEAIGLFEARYVAFLETITHLRPRLHRYCARMTGSVLDVDGEDVMQEAVFEAYRKLDRFDDSRPLSPMAVQDRPQSLHRFPASARGPGGGRSSGRGTRLGSARRAPRGRPLAARSNAW